MSTDTTTTKSELDAEERVKAAGTADADAPLGEGGRRALEAERKQHEAERKLRLEAEQRLEQLSRRVEVLQRGEVERLAAARLAAAEDVWTAGVTLDALLDAGGDIDEGKVSEALDGVLAQRPHWAKPERPMGSSDAGRGQPPAPPSAASLAEEILKGG